ncbi:MAG: CvpA family protein [Oscillospiraceae bacterium]|nr:CvpA family protein [Oscillospiraceae bacterium]
MSVILDVLALGVIASSVLSGFRKGLVYAAAGLLSTVAAVWAAWILANAFAGAVSEIIRPHLEPVIAKALEAAAENGDILPDFSNIPQLQPERILESAAEALKSAGFSAGIEDAFADTVAKNILEKGHTFKEAMTSSVSHAIAFSGILVFGFLIARAVFGIGAAFVSKIFKLPGLNLINKAGGAAAGLVQALIIIVIAGWAIQFAGNIIPEDAVESTRFFKIFAGLDLVKIFNDAIISKI